MAKKLQPSEHSKRSLTTSDGLQHWAAVKAQYGISRGQPDADGLTSKDRIVRAVLDARAAGIALSVDEAARLLPLEARTTSPSTFGRYIRMALGGEQNVPKGRNWPAKSKGCKGDAAAHERRVAEAVPAPDVESQLIHIAESVVKNGYFEPANLEDERERNLREIVQRRGQAEFRKGLLVAYDGRCAVTQCDAVPALEACHIATYVGPQSNRISNELLLWADIHTLFDLDFIGVNPDLKVVLSEQLQRTSYQQLHGVKLRVPGEASWRPSRKALQQRWNRFRRSSRR